MEDNDNKQLEDYALGKLSAEAEAELRAAAQQDPELGRDLRQTELEIRAMQLADRDRLRNQMANWQLAGSENSTAKIIPARRRWIRPLAYAATVLLLLFAGSSWYAANNYSDRAIAEDQFVSRLSTTRSGAAEPTALDRAKDALANDDYAAVETLLAETDEVSALFIRAEARFASGAYDAALADYDQIIAMGEPLARQEAEYLRVVTLLASGRTEAARTELATFGPNHAFAPRLEQLRSRLSNPWRVLVF